MSYLHAQNLFSYHGHILGFQIWNERSYDITYIKTLRSYLDQNGLSNIRIVAADGLRGWGISDDMLKDKQLADAIDYIG